MKASRGDGEAVADDVPQEGHRQVMAKLCISVASPFFLRTMPP